MTAVCSRKAQAQAHVNPCDPFQWGRYRPVLMPFVRFTRGGLGVEIYAGLVRCDGAP